MKGKLPTGRAFERTLRKPVEFEERDRQKERPRKFFYERLMQVSFKHAYYNASKDECPDFRVVPTPTTTLLMNKLGLLFKDEGTGFSVLYDTGHEESLLQFLRRQGEEGKAGEDQVWTRLSFTLSLKNPYFVNFTAIPIDTNAAEENLYFTNQQARRRGGAVVLDPRTSFSREDEDLVTVASMQIPVRTGEKVKDVQVRAISGKVVICKPRCYPRAFTGDEPRDPEAPIISPDAVTCKEADAYLQRRPNAVQVCRNTVYINFGLLPEDKYTIEKTFKDGRAPRKREVLYTSSYPTPLCFINLLFAKPVSTDPPTPGIYPVRDLWERAKSKIVPVNYQLRFENRSTFWNYFVTPQPQWESFTDLSIESKPRVKFAGPCPVRLADGTAAFRFLSRRRVPLQQRSTYHFQLCGKHEMMKEPEILVRRLPVAMIQQVLPENEVEACRVLAIQLIGEGRLDGSCREIFNQLCRCPCKELQSKDPQECLKKLLTACARLSSDECRQLQRKCAKKRNYSDIYVYV